YACLCRERREFDRRLRRSEIEDAVGFCHGGERITAYRDPHLAAACEETRILADRDRIRLLKCSSKMRAGRLADDFNEDTAHASSRSRNDKTHITHGWCPQVFDALFIAFRRGKENTGPCRARKSGCNEVPFPIGAAGLSTPTRLF